MNPHKTVKLSYFNFHTIQKDWNSIHIMISHLKAPPDAVKIIRRSAPSDKPWIHWRKQIPLRFTSNKQNWIMRAQWWNNHKSVKRYDAGTGVYRSFTYWKEGCNRCDGNILNCRQDRHGYQHLHVYIPEILPNVLNQQVEFLFYACEQEEGWKDLQQSGFLYWLKLCLSLLQLQQL